MIKMRIIFTLPVWRRILILILSVLFVSTAVFIFVRSSKDEVKTSDESDKIAGIIKPVAKNVVFKINLFSEKQKEDICANFNDYVRKAAHFSEYTALSAILTALLYALPEQVFYRRYCSPVWALCFSMIYACSDEIHQYFVPGRSMRFYDVMIDSSGALLGAVVVFVIYVLIKSHRKRRDKAR